MAVMYCEKCGHLVGLPHVGKCKGDQTMSLQEMMEQKFIDDGENATFTLTFRKDELLVMAVVADSLLVDKIAVLKNLTDKQQDILRDARDLLQKQIDFPNIKF